MSNKALGMLLALVGALVILFSIPLYRSGNIILGVLCTVLGILAVLFGFAAARIGKSKSKATARRYAKSSSRPSSPELEPLDEPIRTVPADNTPAPQVAHRSGRIELETPDASSGLADTFSDTPAASLPNNSVSFAPYISEAEPAPDREPSADTTAMPESTAFPEAPAEANTASPDTAAGLTPAPDEVPLETADAPDEEVIPPVTDTDERSVAPAPVTEDAPTESSSPAATSEPIFPSSVPPDTDVPTEAPIVAASPTPSAESTDVIAQIADLAITLSADAPARPTLNEAELDICHWALNTLREAGSDIRLLGFGGSSGYLSVNCVNTVMRFKPKAKKPYFLVKAGSSLPSGFETSSATKSEGTDMLRVFYPDITALTAFNDFLVTGYNAALQSVVDAARRSEHGIRNAAETISRQFRL